MSDENSVEPGSDLNPVVRRFVEEAGNATQGFGLGRVLGQIYAFLYFSMSPRSLGDMQAGLGISKGSASMGVRQLEQWSAVRRVWVRGDRKDYYEANDWFGRILRNAVVDIIGKRMSSYTELLQDVAPDIEQLKRGDGDEASLAEKVAHLKSFQAKAQEVWRSPILKLLLK